MTGIVIGLGEVGTALQEVLGCDGYDFKDGDELLQEDYDVLHIAFPWGDQFVEHVRHYRWVFDPKVTIIYSTVPIGTSESLDAVHSPIEGQHPNLAEAIRTHTRWLGSSDERQLIAATLLWKKGYGIEVRPILNADFTEFLKLRSTARYGINIAFANYEATVADEIDMPWQILKEFDQDYNHLYRILTKGGSDVGRYVLDDPQGHIGGHCIVPNAKILDDQYPSSMLEEILRLGHNRNGGDGE